MFIRTIARPLLASWFVYGGVRAALDPKPRAARAEPVLGPVLQEAGVEVDVADLVRLHGASQALAGLALATSRTPRTAALAVASLATVTAAAARPFWLIKDEKLREIEIENFVKNLSLLGGALIAATAGNKKRRRAKRRK